MKAVDDSLGGNAHMPEFCIEFQEVCKLPGGCLGMDPWIRALLWKTFAPPLLCIETFDTEYYHPLTAYQPSVELPKGSGVEG